MQAIEAVISDASSLRPQQDDESERPLTDSSEDDTGALADEGQLPRRTALSPMQQLIVADHCSTEHCSITARGQVAFKRCLSSGNRCAVLRPVSTLTWRQVAATSIRQRNPNLLHCRPAGGDGQGEGRGWRHRAAGLPDSPQPGAHPGPRAPRPHPAGAASGEQVVTAATT